MSTIRVGTEVRWTWGDGSATGTVKRRFTRTVTRTLGGSEITKHGSEGVPAYLIEQDDGSRVLKLKSEIRRA